MKKHFSFYFFVLLFSLVSFSAYNQHNMSDSLRQIIRSAKSDTARVRTMSRLVTYYMTANLDSALFFSNEMLNIAQKIDDKKGITMSYNGIGEYLFQKYKLDSSIYYHRLAYKIAEETNNLKLKQTAVRLLGIRYKLKGQTDSALVYMQKALEFSKLLKDSNLISTTFNSLGSIYQTKGLYDMALQNYLKSLDYSSNATNLKGTIYRNIGTIYSEQKNFDKALQYNMLAYNFFKEKDNLMYQAFSCTDIGLVYSDLKNYERAIEFHTQALQLAQQAKHRLSVAVSYNNLGDNYLSLRKFNKATDCYSEALKISQHEGNFQLGEQAAYNGFAQTYTQTGKYAEAEKMFDKAFNLSKIVEDNEQNLLLWQTGMELYEKNGNFKRAFDCSKQYYSLKDSMFAQEEKRQVNELFTKYETEKKEHENTILKQEKKLAELQVTNRNKWILGLCGGLVVLIVLLALLSRLYQTRNLSYKHIVKTNIENINALEEFRRTNEELHFYKEQALLKQKLEPQQISIIDRLDKKIEDEKSYHNPDLSIEQCAELLGVNSRELSAEIKRAYNCNFTTYINNYRVLEAKIILMKPDALKFKLEAIAEQVGFGSKSTFYAVFKNVTGVTPSYFRDNQNGL